MLKIKKDKYQRTRETRRRGSYLFFNLSTSVMKKLKYILFYFTFFLNLFFLLQFTPFPSFFSFKFSFILFYSFQFSIIFRSLHLLMCDWCFPFSECHLSNYLLSRCHFWLIEILLFYGHVVTLPDDGS